MKGLFIPNITSEMFRNGCLEGIEALMAEGEIYDIECDPSAQRWIPCSERLPDAGEYYFVTVQHFGWNCTEYREIDIAKYWFDGWHKDGTALEVGTVSAWCELPEPWKGGQDGTD